MSIEGCTVSLFTIKASNVQGVFVNHEAKVINGGRICSVKTGPTIKVRNNVKSSLLLIMGDRS